MKKKSLPYHQCKNKIRLSPIWWLRQKFNISNLFTGSNCTCNHSSARISCIPVVSPRPHCNHFVLDFPLQVREPVEVLFHVLQKEILMFLAKRSRFAFSLF